MLKAHLPSRPDAKMTSQGDNAVAQMKNWSQRVNTEIQGALDWYKEWGIIFQRENNAEPPSIDELIRQREAELRKYVGNCGRAGRVGGAF